MSETVKIKNKIIQSNPHKRSVFSIISINTIDGWKTREFTFNNEKVMDVLLNKENILIESINNKLKQITHGNSGVITTPASTQVFTEINRIIKSIAYQKPQNVNAQNIEKIIKMVSFFLMNHFDDEIQVSGDLVYSKTVIFFKVKRKLAHNHPWSLRPHDIAEAVFYFDCAEIYKKSSAFDYLFIFLEKEILKLFPELSPNFEIPFETMVNFGASSEEIAQILKNLSQFNNQFNTSSDIPAYPNIPIPTYQKPPIPPIKKMKNQKTKELLKDPKNRIETVIRFESLADIIKFAYKLSITNKNGLSVITNSSISKPQLDQFIHNSFNEGCVIDIEEINGVNVNLFIGYEYDAVKHKNIYFMANKWEQHSVVQYNQLLNFMQQKEESYCVQQLR